MRKTILIPLVFGFVFLIGGIILSYSYPSPQGAFSKSIRVTGTIAPDNEVTQPQGMQRPQRPTDSTVDAGSIKPQGKQAVQDPKDNTRLPEAADMPTNEDIAGLIPAPTYDSVSAPTQQGWYTIDSGQGNITTHDEQTDMIGNPAA